MPAGLVFIRRLLRQKPVMHELPLPWAMLWSHAANAMPRPRYRQDPLPLGSDAPPSELFGPEQELPPGLQLAEQGQLPVVPLGPLFEEQAQEGN